MRHLTTAVLASLLLAAAGIAAESAESLTIGAYLSWPEVTLELPGILIGPGPHPARTYVNLAGAAPSSGTIRLVAFRTTDPGRTCSAAVKVIFYRQGLNTIERFAERGPFTVASGFTSVVLPAPVEIQAGDLIGISILDGDCYQLLAPVGQRTKSFGSMSVHGDPAVITLSGGAPAPRFHPSLALAIYGAERTDPEVRTQVIVAAASAAGVGGSRFKTDIQLVNTPGPEFVFYGDVVRGTVLGRLVYHPEGTSGTPSDVSVPFKLAPGESRTITDIVGSLGLSGKGSIDVYTALGFEPPVAVARVYEDSGGATKGFTMDAQLVDQALRDDAVLFTPTDPAKFRMNIGVRTLDHPTTLRFSVLRPNGTARTAGVERSYPANHFVQTEASQLLGTPLQAGDAILIRFMSEGYPPVFVYGSIIDNASQDPSLQFATVLK